MRHIKLLLALLLFAGLSFAAPPWLGTAAVALMLSIVLLAITYGLGTAFDVNELKFLVHEEAYQLIVTAIMIGILLGGQTWLDSFSSAFEMPAGMSLQDGAIKVVGNELDLFNNTYKALNRFAVIIGRESSKSYYCSLEGVGFTASPCSAFRALTPPVSLSYQALSFAIAELSSLHILLNFAVQSAFTLLLPIGLLLRTFKFTRGAGGMFIGFAVALYLFVPVSIAFMNVVLNPQTGYNPGFAFSTLRDLRLPDSSCSEDSFGTFSGGVNYDNYNSAAADFDKLVAKVRVYLYIFLIRGTMLTILSLLVFYASFRAVSKLAGAEIDISALARLA